MRALRNVQLVVGLCVLATGSVVSAQNAETTQSAELYAGPDESYPVVAQVDEGTPVQVMGCLEDWSWCDVALQDTRGWLYSPDLSYAYQGGYVPFYTYAPSFGIPVVQFTVVDYWDHYYRGRPWYSRRAEWIDRPPPHHRRPEGPPPSAGPPPKSARIDHPPHDARSHHEDQSRQASAPREAPPNSDRPIRLGSADRDHPRSAERPAIESRPKPESRAPAPADRMHQEQGDRMHQEQGDRMHQEQGDRMHQEQKEHSAPGRHPEEPPRDESAPHE